MYLILCHRACSTSLLTTRSVLVLAVGQPELQLYVYQHDEHYRHSFQNAAHSNTLNLSWFAAGVAQQHLRVHADHLRSFPYRNLDPQVQD